MVPEILGKLSEIVVGEIGEEVVHRGVLASTTLERRELVVEVAGGLACEAGEIEVASSFTLDSVTGCAGLDSVSHVRRIRKHTLRFRQDGP